MFCERCGAENTEDARFCIQCGAELPRLDHLSMNEACAEKRALNKKFIIILSAICLVMIISIVVVWWVFHDKDDEPMDVLLSDGVKSAKLDAEYEVEDDALDLSELSPVYTNGEAADCWRDCKVYVNNRPCKAKAGKVWLPSDFSEDSCTLRVEWVEDNTKYFCERAVALLAAENDDWKDAFIYYLENESDVENQEGYMLIYLDDDDIPELVECGIGEASGSRIINYADGEASITQLRRLGFEYVEYGNILNNSNGNMGFYYDNIYEIQDGVMTLIAEGTYEDEYGEGVYECTWNGKSVSEREYNDKINEIYDRDEATLCPENFDDLLSVDEIIEEIYAL